MRLWRRENPTNFQLLEPLGEGLTSQVYKAIRKHMDLGVEQTVAVKVFNSRKAVQALKNEIGILTQIESMHCVRLLGWADLKQGPAILLEYLDGVSLFDLCAYESIPVKIVDEIIAQLQIGLRDLHHHGISHGDISAKNIFITNRGVVKILDFGFSKGLSKVTQELFGTPQFLAVEAWRGEELTHQSDLFALGLLRLDLLNSRVLQHGTKESWRRRAAEVCGQNQLLEEEPAQRRFLPLSSSEESRTFLASLVGQAQEKKRAFKSTTRVLGGQAAKESSHWSRTRWAPGLSFCLVFFFFINLQPASLNMETQKPQKSDLYIDVRSQDWAQVKLFKKQSDGLEELAREVYAPFKFRKLHTGNYELHWKSQGRTGIIFVQLTQSRRILIR